ncbi:MAG TPA: hypothetical protein DCS88_05575 [Alphaproteobacteria bacterium]|nr:hypothetical protein [Alphaproteobacteria bacterium]
MSIQLRYTLRFHRDMKRLNDEVCKRVKKSLQQFIENQKHPGLNFERIVGTEFSSIRAGKNYRIILEEETPTSYIVLRVAPHDIYRTL